MGKFSRDASGGVVIGSTIARNVPSGQKSPYPKLIQRAKQVVCRHQGNAKDVGDPNCVKCGKEIR